MWLQVLHGANIANSVRGVRTSPAALDRFAIDLGAPPWPGRIELRSQQLVSHANRLRVWRRQPHLGLEWVDATVDRCRGTHTKPQSDDLSSPFAKAARSIIPR